jgi:hypothetical protein
MGTRSGREVRRRGGMDWADLPGRARGFHFDPPARGSLQTVCERPARMLVAEASEQKLDGQVFWLTAHDGPRTAFPPRGSGLSVRGPGRLQRRPRDGFSPSSLFSPRLSRAGGTCRGPRLEPFDPVPVKWRVDPPTGSTSARRHYPSASIDPPMLSSVPPPGWEAGFRPQASSKTTSSRGILVSHPTRSSRGWSANSTG